jgi:hypothetical protein
MNASTLVVAGSETTATTVTAALYFLLTNAHVYRRLVIEVRSAFQSKDEITITTVNKLEYMLACLNETMRILPAVPGGLPRVVPHGGRVLNKEFVPQDVGVLLQKLVLSDNLSLCRPLCRYGIGLFTTMTSSFKTLSSFIRNDFLDLKNLFLIRGSFCSPSTLEDERVLDDRKLCSSCSICRYSIEHE